jgi:S1-C subfamily serine protease
MAVRAAPVAALAAALVPRMNAGQAADISSGSGVVIGAYSEILTNAHVVENCAQITVRSSSGDLTAAPLVARDEKSVRRAAGSGTRPRFTT